MMTFDPHVYVEHNVYSWIIVFTTGEIRCLHCKKGSWIGEPKDASRNNKAQKFVASHKDCLNAHSTL